MQEGVVGLLRALTRYDPGHGTPFWAYAAWWVRQAMQQHVARTTGPIDLSDRALRQLARIEDACARRSDACHPCADAGLDVGRVRRIEWPVGTDP
jgi:DNA-directed RNA polymerase specialized sigma subunit